jgi:hypothetical protein
MVILEAMDLGQLCFRVSVLMDRGCGGTVHTRDDDCAPGKRQLRTGSGLGAIGPTEETGQTADVKHPRCAGTERWLSGTDREHTLGRTGRHDLASGLGTVNAQDLYLLQRPRAHAAAGGLLPGFLQWGQTAYELSAAVAAARAPRCDSSAMAGAKARWNLKVLTVPPFDRRMKVTS